jgi:hypothetical protein
MRGSTHPGALESGADDGEALGIRKCEPISRPRLYKIAHSARFLRIAIDQNGRHPFSFQELPDSYVRIIPKVAKPKPIAIVQLNTAAESAPLLNRSAHPYLALAGHATGNGN